MFFLLFCFLLFLGFIISALIRVLFVWLRFKNTKQQNTNTPQHKFKKRFDSSDAEDAEFEEVDKN